MFESLRSRLAITNLLITLCGLAIVVVVFTQLVAQRSADLKQGELAKQSRAVARLVEDLITRKGGSKDLKAQIISESMVLEERIIVVSRRHIALVDSAHPTKFDQGTWTKEDLQHLSSNKGSGILGGGKTVSFVNPIYGAPVGKGKQVKRPLLGTIVLVAHSADVSPSLPSLLGVVGIAAVTAILVWIFIAFYFTYSISRPLLRIIGATREMARGNYRARVDVGGHSEISRLATSFNAMASQVQTGNQVLKDFVANVSHDLRTPLTMITGFSQAMLDGTAGPDEMDESAAIIHDEAVKMQHLVDDLLQLTRLESGLLTLDRRPTELRPLVQRVVERVGRSRSEPSAAILNSVPADLAPVDIDSERFERVVRNLVDNALQYTPMGGSVTVAARASGGGVVEVSVSDTGSGIPARDLSRIFERFYRVDKGRERQHGHSGLGLAIVRELVEAHGGQVSVESEPGRGTTFRFTLTSVELSPQEHPKTRQTTLGSAAQ